MKIGVVSGSFDPITKGHLYVIEQALKMVDQVIVLVADNPDKKYMFERKDRHEIVVKSCAEKFGMESIFYDQILVRPLPNNAFTAHVAELMGATLIFRGLRNVVDFEYEHGQQLVNSTISPNITTVFVMPPPELIAVSSSMIRGMRGIEGWEQIAEKYLPAAAMERLK